MRIVVPFLQGKNVLADIYLWDVQILFFRRKRKKNYHATSRNRTCVIRTTTGCTTIILSRREYVVETRALIETSFIWLDSFSVADEQKPWKTLHDRVKWSRDLLERWSNEALPVWSNSTKMSRWRRRALWLRTEGFSDGRSLAISRSQWRHLFWFSKNWPYRFRLC